MYSVGEHIPREQAEQYYGPLTDYVRADLFEEAVKLLEGLVDQYGTIRNASEGVAGFPTDDRAVTLWAEFDAGPMDKARAFLAAKVKS